MQYLEMTKDMTLSKLASVVGERNVDSVLNANGLDRSVNIGKDFAEKIKNISSEPETDYQKKMSILNQFVGDYDLYEKAALGTEQDWNALATYNCFTDAIQIPIEVQLPPSVGILGNSEPVSGLIYDACISDLKKSGKINISHFSEYAAIPDSVGLGVSYTGATSTGEPFQWFKLPWGEITLYSSISGEMLEFPVYPEGMDDGVSANFDEMGEMLYQYEPWKVYKSSGPRQKTFTFEFHRDMWNGDHRDGCANDLIRGCEANCYPNFDGSLVNVPLVTLYIHGVNNITGVMTDCKTNWKGPIGLDGFYLVCELSFTIVEVSQQALSYDVIRNKGLLE